LEVLESVGHGWLVGGIVGAEVRSPTDAEPEADAPRCKRPRRRRPSAPNERTASSSPARSRLRSALAGVQQDPENLDGFLDLGLFADRERSPLQRGGHPDNDLDVVV
jgi:hypothetical protein